MLAYPCHENVNKLVGAAFLLKLCAWKRRGEKSEIECFPEASVNRRRVNYSSPVLPSYFIEQRRYGFPYLPFEFQSEKWRCHTDIFDSGVVVVKHWETTPEIRRGGGRSGASEWIDSPHWGSGKPIGEEGNVLAIFEVEDSEKHLLLNYRNISVPDSRDDVEGLESDHRVSDHHNEHETVADGQTSQQTIRPF